MRRPRTAALALAGGLLLGGPALSACSGEPAAGQVESTDPSTDQDVDDEVEELEDDSLTEEGSADEQVEGQVEDLDDESSVDGVDAESQ